MVVYQSGFESVIRRTLQRQTSSKNCVQNMIHGDGHYFSTKWNMVALGMNNYAHKYQINKAGIGEDVMSIRYSRFLLQLLHGIFKFISLQPEGIIK
jgi:hypothetical protein